MMQSYEENRTRLWDMLDPDINFIFRSGNAVFAYAGDDTPTYIGIMWSVERSNLAAKLTLNPHYLDLWEKHVIDKNTLITRPTRQYIANRDLIWPAINPKWKWLAMDGDGDMYLYTHQPVWKPSTNTWAYPDDVIIDDSSTVRNVTGIFINIWPLSQSPETSLLSREIWEKKQQEKQNKPEDNPCMN